MLLEQSSLNENEYRSIYRSGETNTTPALAPSRHATPLKNIIHGGITSM